ncbi:MAG TPA: hypothetical protein QF644_03085, partial [Candidatus Poseidoniaceae archaeon]|nr:hypothetical protein [Candidatus Poseidoniaceae archaeon]
MDDSITSEPWWQGRINEVKSKGFNTENIVIKLNKNESQASALLEQYEAQISLSISLKEEVEKLPNSLEVERIKLLKQLKNVEDATKIQGELNSLISTFFPWRIAAKSNKILWDSAGRGMTLGKIIRKLDNLDSSMNSHILDLLPLFETPETFNELIKKINNIEVRQSERIATLDSMASLLSERGFEIQGFNEMSLEERFDAVEELQKLDEKHMELERRIKRTIGRFDLNAATNYDSQRMLLTKTRSNEEFDSLVERVRVTEKNYLIRLENINNQFSSWIQEGFKLNIHIPILADELLERESQVEKISENIGEYKLIWDRLVHQYNIWPEEEAVTEIEYGIISEKNDIEIIVIELERRSSLIEEEVQSKITKWKDKEFELNEIERLCEINPRLAQNKMEGAALIFEQIVEAKYLLNTLDLSFLGSEKKKMWDDKLKKSIPNKIMLEELMKWISITEKRNLRHRNMLEKEWLKFQNVPDINVSELTLMEFEKLIQKRELDYSKKSNVLNQKNNLKDRLLIQVKFWIENLKKEGWNIETLELMIDENPNVVLDAKSEISKQILNYNKLIKRLEKLPWKRNISLAEEVLNNLRKPELLKEIHDLVPQYMQILANSPIQYEDVDFDFIPWLPDNKFTPVIKPKDIPEAEVIIDDQELEPIEEKEQVTTVLPIQENKNSEIIKSIKSIKYQPDTKEWEIYTKLLKKILVGLGINVNQDLNEVKSLDSLSSLRKELAKQVGVTPRDSRVDRLLRILLRVIPINLPEGLTLLSLTEIIEKLTYCVLKLNEWTSKRLERRHSTPSGKLLEDSKVLGIALEKIPS